MSYDNSLILISILVLFLLFAALYGSKYIDNSKEATVVTENTMDEYLKSKGCVEITYKKVCGEGVKFEDGDGMVVSSPDGRCWKCEESF